MTARETAIVAFLLAVGCLAVGCKDHGAERAEPDAIPASDGRGSGADAAVTSAKPALAGGMDWGGDWQSCVDQAYAGGTFGPTTIADCYASQVPQKSYVSAQTFEIPWMYVEPTAGTFDWDQVDQALAVVDGRGQRMRLRITSGVYSPDWVKHLGGGPIPFYNINTYLGGDQTAPVYWSSEYKDAWKAVMTAAAARYDGDPRLAEIETCMGGLVSCETFLIFASEKTGKGTANPVSNGQHLFDAGFSDAIHLQTIAEDLQFMNSVWRSTRIQLTVQPFHHLGSCNPGMCQDAGGGADGLAITKAFIDGDGSAIATTAHDGSSTTVSITGLQVLSPPQAVFFHTGLGPKEIGGTMDQPAGDATTIALYNYLYDQNGVTNAQHHPYTVPLQTETQGRLDIVWAQSLDYACQVGSVAVELPHGYSTWEKPGNPYGTGPNADGSWTLRFGHAAAQTYPGTPAGVLAILDDADACYKANAALHD